MGDSSGRHRGVVFLGVGAAAALSGLLAELQTNVLSLHLYTDVKWIVSALVLILLATMSTSRTRGAEAMAKVSSINSALIGGATRALRDRRLDEFGVMEPSDRIEAVRPEDHAVIDSSLMKSWLVCVIGPESACTAAAAFKALQARAPDARLIAPVDGDGLRTILDVGDELYGAVARAIGSKAIKDARTPNEKLRALWRWLAGSTQVQLVVWLYGLERFVSKLDSHGLRRLLRDTSPATKRRSRGLRHRSRPDTQSSGQREMAAVRLLVTMRASDYEVIEAGEDDDALRARRLLAQADVIRLPAAKSGQGATLPTAPSAEPVDARRYGAVDPLTPRLAINGTFGALTILTVGLAIAMCLRVIHHRGFQPPPPLDDQAQRVESSLPSCETPAPPMRAGSVASGEDWVLPVQAGSCPRSDFVSVYANDSGHLDYVLTERPRSQKIWIFRCALASGCIVPAGGRNTLIIGAFMHYSGETQIALPIILYREDAATDVRMLAPYLPPPNHHVPPIALRLAPGAVSDISAQSVCKRPAELCGVPPTYITALPAGSEESQTGIPARAVILIAGYVQRGPYYAPTAVVTRAFVVEYSQDDKPPVLFGPTPCTSTTGHKYYKMGSLSKSGRMVGVSRREQALSGLLRRASGVVSGR